MDIILILDYYRSQLYAERKICNAGHVWYASLSEILKSKVYKGLQSSVESCGLACKGVASIFLYGTNDYVGGKSDSADCYCETDATDQGTCNTTKNGPFRMYRYLNSGVYVTCYLQCYMEN